MTLKMIRRMAPAQVTDLGDDQVDVVVTTGNLARDGHIFEPEGGNLTNYLKNPIVLWSHNPEVPVGRAESISVAGGKIVARVRFAPAGVSPKADEVRGLVKSGIVNGVSVGIEPIECEPLDPRKPRGGQRVSQWEMIEFSFCSIPVDTEATVTARAEKTSEWKVGASRDLEIEDSDAWDGAAAKASIFEHAGGDDFDPKVARQGFLVYDASAPEKRGSYKLPIARAADGKLVVPKGAIRAAASRLPDTDVPDDVKKRAQAVLDHYKEKAGIGEDDQKDGDRSFSGLASRLNRMGAPNLKLERGLYDVAQLAYILAQLGYSQDSAAFETAVEGDQSKVPGMLGDALISLGEAFLAMAEEEVSELIDAATGKNADEPEVGTKEDRALIAAAPTERVRAWRRAYVAAKTRAGKTISAATAKSLQDVMDLHEEAMDHHRKALRKHRQALSKTRDMIDGAGVPGADPDAANDDGNSTTIQKSNGVAEDQGSRSFDFRKRRAAVLALAQD